MIRIGFGDEHSALVYGIANRLLGIPAAADITQQVFLRLWERPDSFDPERGTLRTFLAVMARRRSIDNLRGRIRTTRREQTVARQAPASAPDVDEAAMAMIASERVRAAVATLPPEQRQAIELAYFDGLTFREVATVTGVPEGTAKSRLRLALARLAGLRDELLTAARAVPQQRDLASSPVQAYRHQLAVFSEVVDRIAGHQWHLQTHPYSWSLHGLVAHLLQIEQYMERSLGLTDGPADEFETDHLQFGHRQIQDELTRSPGATVATWREVVARIDPHLDALDLEHGLVFHQWPFAVRSLLIARSFELWTHADDVRRAIGEPVAGPAGADVRAMSDTSVRSLPLAIHVVTDQVPNGRARIVLTGSGGGVWDLQLGAGGDELVTVVADAIDYCRVAARRLTIDELDAVIEGDAELAGRLLTAAAIVAV